MGRTADVERRIALKMAAQHGLITSGQLAEIGVSTNGVRSRLDHGLLVRVCQGVYRSPSALITWDQRILAAYTANRPYGVVSHFAGARLLGLNVGSRERIEITLPMNRHGIRVGDMTLHWSLHLTSKDIVELGLLRTTSVPRTLIDLAGLLPRDQLLSAMDDAVLRHLCTPRNLAVTLARPEFKRRKGTATMREGVELWLAETIPKSVAEARLLRAIGRAGIELPVCQYEVSDGAGFTAKIDFAWPAELVAVEMDGYRYHGSPRAFGDDYERECRLAELGWSVLRTTPHAFDRSPERFLRRLRRELNQRKLPRIHALGRGNSR